METKKNKRVDLENFRGIFFIVGLVISMGIILYAFEWKGKAQSDVFFGDLKINATEEELTPLIKEKKEIPAPPPLIAKEFIWVGDNVDLPEPEVPSSEIDNRVGIYIAPFIIKDTCEESNEVFVTVDKMPEFPGGINALLNFIARSIKYPVIARENGIQGKVFVQFVVNSKGKVINTKIVRSIDPSLDQEALRVINMMPLWKPGEQAGKAVNVCFTVPIKFVLM